ncbi:MAG: hypothetical protein LBG87_01940 [Spirochaetaceae bacterium]|jgi:hypothetical protein|nr:hypothetical protein [Spirochaetaceae bacterium]
MWERFKPKENVWYRWRLNGAEAYLRKNCEIWQTAFTPIPLADLTDDFGGPDEGADPPADAALSTAWSAGDEASLHPCLSPQPYLLTVREKARVLPGMGTGFRADLPPLLKFELASDEVLSEAMPFIVPQTWFGQDTMTGEFGHSLLGRLSPHQEKPEEYPATLIRCEIYIKNNAKTAFDLDNFAVYPEPLSVYRYKDRLISDTLELEFLGVSEFAGTMEKVTVNEIEGAEYTRISLGTKTGVGETIARRSVDIIKNITRFY